MELRVIKINEDATADFYASPECQDVSSSMNDFYPKIGFNMPWVGYFVFDHHQVVGTGGFTG
jgi:[ribosomal protein S5]-alanine N-acetyltransferase